MERDEAIRRLNLLKGQNLHDLAPKYEVTVVADNGEENKGWAGHLLERYLGLPINSAQSPNCGSWELKCVPLLRYKKSGRLYFKESMKITSIDPFNVRETPFESSRLLAKLQKAVIVARTVGSHFSLPTFVYSVTPLDLVGDLYNVVRADYELVRVCLNDPSRGFSHLTGYMGTYVQPRTSGKGHGSTSRSFYARTKFLKTIIDLKE